MLDCRFGMKESESEDDCVGSTRGILLSEVWYMVAMNQTIARDSLLQGRLRVTENVRWRGLLQVSAWHDHSYIARISFILAHGWCNHIVVWLDQYLMHVCVDVSDAFCCYTCSGSPQDDQHLSSKVGLQIGQCR